MVMVPDLLHRTLHSAAGRPTVVAATAAVMVAVAMVLALILARATQMVVVLVVVKLDSAACYQPR